MSWGILLGYYIFIFIPRRVDHPRRHLPSFPGVSMIIAVKNGSRRLTQNLPALLHQQYPLFEMIIVNDHSTPEERIRLDRLQTEYPQIRVLHSDKRPGKKQALTFGIEQATYDWILCTDADCRPLTDQWIRSMMGSSDGANMVLGYSPYASHRGLLHLLIQFETLMTGMQYLSWAIVGRPYMGVGRNLLYSKDFFLKMNPYATDHLPYGDDDLWVQQAAQYEKVTVCIDPVAQVLSDVPETWSAWWRQKHRHMSAGHAYAPSRWWQPGLFGIALILHWATLPVILSAGSTMWVWGASLFGLTLRWLIFGIWLRRLKEKTPVILYPMLELIYTLYLAVMGLITLVTKKKTWN